MIGNCRLGDVKAEKPGNYEILAPVGTEKFFECDLMKGTVVGGTESVIKFVFIPP